MGWWKNSIESYLQIIEESKFVNPVDLFGNGIIESFAYGINYDNDSLYWSIHYWDQFVFWYNNKEELSNEEEGGGGNGKDEE